MKNTWTLTIDPFTNNWYLRNYVTGEWKDYEPSEEEIAEFKKMMEN